MTGEGEGREEEGKLPSVDHGPSYRREAVIKISYLDYNIHNYMGKNLDPLILDPQEHFIKYTM